MLSIPRVHSGIAQRHRHSHLCGLRISIERDVQTTATRHICSSKLFNNRKEKLRIAGVTGMAYYRPVEGAREIPVNPAETALLFIDVQNFNCNIKGALMASMSPEKLQECGHYLKAIEDASPLWSELRGRCRSAGIEVMYTVIQSLTKDGRDRSHDYKRTGFHVPPGCWDAETLECITPGDDEIVLPKTSSSVFQSTNLDYLLRNMDKKYLVLCGALTDQCVGHAVRDACDLGYLVTLITDCCVTFSPERQKKELDINKGYCRHLTSKEFIAELNGIESK